MMNIDLNTMLDCQEERLIIIEKIKDRLLELCEEKVMLENKLLNDYGRPYRDDELTDYHLVEIDHEICERIQDYHQILYDFREDWELNYDYQI